MWAIFDLFLLVQHTSPTRSQFVKFCFSTFSCLVRFILVTTTSEDLLHSFGNSLIEPRWLIYSIPSFDSIKTAYNAMFEGSAEIADDESVEAFEVVAEALKC